MKYIAFTICSNNYLAQAKSLTESFLKFHDSFKFVIVLVDEYADEIDYSVFAPSVIIPISALNIKDFDKLQKQYNIVELNTAVKPFCFSYLFETKKALKIIYIDPDILVFSKFEELLDIMDTHSIILTPQTCTPIDDAYSPRDQNLLATGIFNLGFIALSGYQNVKDFLIWWSDRIVKYGYGNPAEHMFYDQLLITLVPVFFNGYYILKHIGYNMAVWNMHERIITQSTQEEIIINNNSVLRFFHYSGYKLHQPDKLCWYIDRFTFESRPDVKFVFKTYHDILIKNEFLKYAVLKPVYGKLKEAKPIQETGLTNKIFKKVKNLIKG